MLDLPRVFSTVPELCEHDHVLLGFEKKKCLQSLRAVNGCELSKLGYVHFPTASEKYHRLYGLFLG